MLAAIAAQDARIRRLTERQPTGPFARPRRFRRTDLPPALKYLKIKRLMAASWQPDWHDIKDEEIAEVSSGWARETLISWLERWQRDLREQQRRSRPAEDDGPQPLAERENEPLPETFTVDLDGDPQTVAVLIDAEPLRDGGWTVSVAVPSGHPFFDRHALEQIERAAELFPPWPEGYGSAVRYRLEARFIIVPPSTSSIFGLSCAFPFCTPEELKELKVIHWFKKIIDTNVYFEGLLEAPPVTPDDAVSPPPPRPSPPPDPPAPPSP
jgi:hypothetical protein